MCLALLLDIRQVQNLRPVIADARLVLHERLVALAKYARLIVICPRCRHVGNQHALIIVGVPFPGDDWTKIAAKCGCKPSQLYTWARHTGGAGLRELGRDSQARQSMLDVSPPRLREIGHLHAPCSTIV